MIEVLKLGLKQVKFAHAGRVQWDQLYSFTLFHVAQILIFTVAIVALLACDILVLSTTFTQFIASKSFV